MAAPKPSRFGVCSVLFLLLTAAPLTAASPSLALIYPRGCQRGQEHQLSFRGDRLADAQEILFYSPGFEVTKLEPAAKEVKATIKVAPDCRLGEHVAQVRTASGISEYRTFFVGALEAVDEKEPNSEFETPQTVAFNRTVQGVVTAEDVDYFAIEVKKGQRISAEIEAMRLGTTLFDPYLSILDSRRFSLAAADDTPLVRQDCVCSAIAPEDGVYVIEVRDASYGGNGNCRYRLHIGAFPRPLAVYPAGGKAGESTEVTFLGDPAGQHKQVVVAPVELDADFAAFAQDDQGISPSGNPFRVFPHGNVLETEPNNGFAEATAGELPKAFNGIIQEAGDIDRFRFAAKKGPLEVECYARRVRSSLDPVINLYKADGGSIAGNDDSRGPDSYLRFNVPADGEYILRVTDHLGRGGPEFIYRVEFTPVAPSLTLGIPRVARYSQSRQQIVVPRGNRFATLISASRANFGGEIELLKENLPAGITMHCDPMPANLNAMPVVFEAAADAPVAGALIDFRARHVDEKTGIQGGFTNRADFVISAPGQSLYVWKDVAKLPVAVAEEVPFQLQIVEPQAPLVRNGSMNLKIVAQRKEGFTKPISVQLPFRPPGVSARSSVTIPEGKNEVLYPINANGGAQIKDWRIYVIGSADSGGAVWVASSLTKLTVAEPFVTFEVQRASCEQGKPAQIYCKLNQAKPFEGEATVRLLGLPPKTSTEELKFTKDTVEITFPVATDAASPVGKHKNLICRVTLQVAGEPVVATAGVTELQIDKPLPPPKDAPPPAPKPKVKKPEPAKPKPPAAKPLSRLEKLRQAAKAAREAGK